MYGDKFTIFIDSGCRRRRCNTTGWGRWLLHQAAPGLPCRATRTCCRGQRWTRGEQQAETIVLAVGEIQAQLRFFAQCLKQGWFKLCDIIQDSNLTTKHCWGSTSGSRWKLTPVHCPGMLQAGQLTCPLTQSSHSSLWALHCSWRVQRPSDG